MGLTPACVRFIGSRSLLTASVSFRPSPLFSLSSFLPLLSPRPPPSSTTAAPTPPVSRHRSAPARAPACPLASASLLLGPRAPQGSHLPPPPIHLRAAPRRPNSFLPAPWPQPPPSPGPGVLRPVYVPAQRRLHQGPVSGDPPG